jgi:hypothetical protein
MANATPPGWHPDSWAEGSSRSWNGHEWAPLAGAITNSAPPAPDPAGPKGPAQSSWRALAAVGAVIAAIAAVATVAVLTAPAPVRRPRGPLAAAAARSPSAPADRIEATSTTPSTGVTATIPADTMPAATPPTLPPTIPVATAPAPRLGPGDGFALSSGSTWLWPGPPLALTAAQGMVIYPGRIGITDGNYLTAHIVAPAVAGVDLGTDPGQDFDMTLVFEAPPGQSLRPGTYTDATRTPVTQGDGPGIDISGMSHGCNSELGQFTVHSITIGPNGLFDDFDITFTDVCDNVPAISGEIRYTKPPPSPDTGPQGTTIDASLPAPTAATAQIQGIKGVEIDWTPPPGDPKWELFRTDGTAAFDTAVQIFVGGAGPQTFDPTAVRGHTYTYFVVTAAPNSHVSRPAAVTITVPT